MVINCLPHIFILTTSFCWTGLPFSETPLVISPPPPRTCYRNVNEILRDFHHFYRLAMGFQQNPVKFLWNPIDIPVKTGGANHRGGGGFWKCYTRPSGIWVIYDQRLILSHLLQKAEWSNLHLIPFCVYSAIMKSLCGGRQWCWKHKGLTCISVYFLQRRLFRFLDIVW